MAHFTGLKELQNHPHKAGFDIGSKNVFTAKVGELLPVYWDFAIPNCDYDIDLAYFTRTRPVQTAAYTRVREYFDFYAVPCDLLWKSFDSAVIQMGQIAPVQSKTLLDPLTVNAIYFRFPRPIARIVTNEIIGRYTVKTIRIKESSSRDSLHTNIVKFGNRKILYRSTK
jgi:hypothetical protein